MCSRLDSNHSESSNFIADYAFCTVCMYAYVVLFESNCMNKRFRLEKGHASRLTISSICFWIVCSFGCHSFWALMAI